MDIIRLLLLPLFAFFQVNHCQSQNLKESILELDEYFMQVMEDWKVPHMAYGIVKDTQIVAMRGFGFRDIENELPVDENTLFKIGSVSKGMTAITFGILAECEGIGVDTPIEDIVPGFKMGDEYITTHITPRDLLSNRTGLPRHGFLWYGTDYTFEQIAGVLKYLEPVNSFRDKHIYTNLMYDMTGFIVEKASGDSWEDFTRQHLFEPLEMNNSCFGTEIFGKDNHAIPYYFNDETDQFVKGNTEDIMFSEVNIPAGGINVSVSEMCNYLIMNLHGGIFKGDTVVPESFLAQAHSVQASTGISADYSSDYIQYGYGFGWNIENIHNHVMLSHGGRTGYYDCQVLLLPKDSIGIVVMVGANSPANYIISQSLTERVLGKEFFDWNEFGLNNPNWNREPKEIVRNKEINSASPPTLQLTNYEGVYSNPAYGQVIIRTEGNSLCGRRSVVEFELDHIEENKFAIYFGDTMYTGRELSFITDKNGYVSALTIDFERALDPIVFGRQ